MVLFFVTLVISIIVHELAHLLVAKACRCKVEVFSIGFGRPIFKRQIGETLYQVTPFILGGYCKLQDELTYSRKKTSFTNLPYRKKVAITLAGVTTNIIMGTIAIAIAKIPALYLIGYYFLYFGMLNVALGVSNLLPIPALDGSYIYLVWLEKFYGKKRGYEIMSKICKIGFIVLMALNIICLPYLILLIYRGAL